MRYRIAIEWESDIFIDTRSNGEWKLNGLHLGLFIRLHALFFFLHRYCWLNCFRRQHHNVGFGWKIESLIEKKSPRFFCCSGIMCFFCKSATWCNCGVVKLYIFVRARDILYVRLHLCSNRAMGFGFLYITLFDNYFGVFHWALNTNGFQTHSLNNWNRYYTGANRELTIFKILLILSSVTNE